MLSAALHRLRSVRRERPDAGIMLTELLVTMTLLSIVATLALTALISTGNGSARTTDGSIATAAARNTMSAWTGMLQLATMADPATPAARNLVITTTSITFNAQLGTLPSCSSQCGTTAATRVRLALVTANGKSQLVQTLTNGAGAATTIQVTSGAALPTRQCLFLAVLADGTTLPCGTLGANATNAATRIDIAYTVTPDTGPVQSYATVATLPGGST